ncbi:MAG: PadR family transcriptional regulator [Propionibacteriales bacterium]|nr:PadR family transcriptional regulator [Propionibacteriales bacterium]
MNYRNNTEWAAGFAGTQREGVRRQRGNGSGGRGRRHEGWGGPMGGPPPWVGQMFGPQWGGPGAGRGRGRPRARRGDVRSAILDVLAAAPEPINGYQVIQQIAERTQDAWKPSPGSVYPTLAQLQDEGLVEDAPVGRKTVQLTSVGRSHVAENAAEISAIWAAFDEDDDDQGQIDLKQVIKQTVGAIVQVATAGTPAQQAKAVDILAETRRKLYGLLAEGPDAAEED